MGRGTCTNNNPCTRSTIYSNELWRKTFREVLADSSLTQQRYVTEKVQVKVMNSTQATTLTPIHYKLALHREGVRPCTTCGPPTRKSLPICRLQYEEQILQDECLQKVHGRALCTQCNTARRCIACASYHPESYRIGEAVWILNTHPYFQNHGLPHESETAIDALALLTGKISPQQLEGELHQIHPKAYRRNWTPPSKKWQTVQVDLNEERNRAHLQCRYNRITEKHSVCHISTHQEHINRFLHYTEPVRWRWKLPSSGPRTMTKTRIRKYTCSTSPEATW